jgi:phospholipid transport system transporter-binding protein
MIARDGDYCRVQGPITIENVAALLAQGQALLSGPVVTVDLAAVTEVDSSALSLLLEWRREAGRENRSIRYLNLPANLRSLAELYGVTDLISAGS